jgi:hypothetical protein
MDARGVMLAWGASCVLGAGAVVGVRRDGCIASSEGDEGFTSYYLECLPGAGTPNERITELIEQSLADGLTLDGVEPVPKLLRLEVVDLHAGLRGCWME